MLYKPVGIISTASDERGRQKVIDLVKSKNRLFPVGRLDINSEGLILLTNDGDLALKLTHPKFHLEKEYEVVLDREIKNNKIKLY
jgi:23S rRNA pseudouridine2605 synthase